MGSENIQEATSQKDWDDFFSPEETFEDAFNSVDEYAERVRMACKSCRGPLKTTDQRLDEHQEKKGCPPSCFEFDR